MIQNWWRYIEIYYINQHIYKSIYIYIYIYNQYYKNHHVHHYINTTFFILLFFSFCDRWCFTCVPYVCVFISVCIYTHTHTQTIALCAVDVHLSSVKFPEIQFYSYCSGNMCMPAVLGHPNDILLHHSSNCKMRFPLTLTSCLSLFSEHCWCFKREMFSLWKGPHLCNSSSTHERTFLMGRSIDIVT